ncbi:cell wall-binding repeat-containing protein [Clostridium sp. CF012]|uniref:cell wall-binding repeat-containing protein n=1 Tax=Clostridium sp. CF012 TaxID=2843319 RepID=UPI001C0B688C|nr:cell wall-binding repeat-containing protein [Clostridium sp. CF012]MBU3143441.1 5'-nucleotidase C-terminal domain-containing protein [Clostridium sp. CF012]
MFKKKQKKILSSIMSLALVLFNFSGIIGAENVKADTIAVINEGFDSVKAAPPVAPATSSTFLDEATIPTGWIFTGGTSPIFQYTSNGNFGVASPSIKLQSTTGSQITSPVFNLTAPATLTFWLKGQGGGTPSVCTSKLLVEQSDGTDWSNIEDIQLTATTIGIQTYTLQSNIKQVRFSLTKLVGNAAIDDIKILQDTDAATDVTVTAVSLNKATLALGVGQASPLVATIAPTNATNKNLSWSSDNTTVATVTTGGAITAVAEGTATITVTTEDQAKTSLCVVTVSANAPPTNKTFDIVGITDFHGQLLDSTNTKPVGAALAKVVKDVKAANPDRTLIIGGGDMYQGTPVSNVLRGVPVQKVLSNMGMEVTALGNHEFDWGLDVINSETMIGASYSIVCANMYDKGKDTRPYEPYKIFTKDGVKIAVIGAILQEAPTIIMPALVAPFDFRDPATEINTVAAELRAKTGADKIDIVLADVHDGGSSLNTMVNKLHGVDAVFGGHTHSIADVVNKDADGKDVPTLIANSTGKGYINLKITVDAVTKALTFSPRGSNYKALTTAVGTATDSECKKIVDDASEKLLPIFNEKIGTNASALTKDQVDSPYGESQLGNWMADVVKNYPKSPAEVGMVNNGGIRLSPIVAGDITVGTIFNIMPFDNTICTTTMTGAQLKYILEQAVQTDGKGIQISGVKFTYDSSKPSYKAAVVAEDGTITTPEVLGQRVISVVREENSSIVEDTDTLKVNAPDFVATGGDTFTGFLVPEIVTSLVDSHYTVRDALNADVRAKDKMTVVMNNRIDNQMKVVAPVAMTILEARTTLKTAVILTGYVSAVNGNNVFMQDNAAAPTAGICVYNKAGTTFTAKKGDKITVTGNLSTFSGLLEVTPTASTDVVKVSTGNTVTPKEVTVNQVTNSIQGQLVKVKNVKFTSIDNAAASMAEDSTGIINVFKMPVVAGLAVGDIADVTAAVTCYGTTIELAVDSAADVVKTGTIPTPNGATISVVATSDVHGNVLNFDYGTNAEPSTGQGLAKVSTYVKGLRAANPNVMLIDNGDTIQGTPLVYYYNMIDKAKVYPMAAVMGEMGYDTMTLGNHEFNYGLPTLNRVITDAKAKNIHMLSANIYKADGTNFVEPYTIKSFVVNGKTIKVAILGLTTKTVPSWEDPAHYDGLHFNDLVDEAKKWVPIVKAEGADVVIVAAHTGEEGAADIIPENQAKALATEVRGIDAIVAGHAHSTLIDTTLKNPDGKIVPIIEPGKWAQKVSQIDIAVDATGTVTGLTTKNVTMGSTIAEDPAIKSLIAPYQAKTLEYTATVLGQSKGEYKGDKQITQPTEIMELINKVQADAAGTQLSIAAPLSLKAYIPGGDITIKDIMGVYVYENFLYGVKMNGKQIKDWMEYTVRYYKQTSSSADPIVKDPALNIADYNLDQLYGASYDIDLTEPAATLDSNGCVVSGNRIKNLKFNGKLVKDSDAFTVAINNYRYNGGGGFMAAAGFVPGSPATIAATFYDSAKVLGDDGQVRNMMFKYVQDNGTISPTNSNNWKIIVAPVSTGGSTSISTGGSTPVVTTPETVIPVVTKTDSNSNVVATLDSSKIDINKVNVIKIDEPKAESKIQVQIPASAIGTGTGSFKINTKAASLSIPTSIIDASLLSSGGTLQVSQNIMATTDANALLVNIPTGGKTNGKVFTFVMSIYDSKNNLVSDIHNFASGKSVGITINLSNEDIKGMDTSKISAFYFDVTSKKWVDMGGSFDSIKMAYTFNTTHFSDFTIMQKLEVYVSRLSGDTRIETSIAIAKEQYTTTKPDAVVLATASGFADALVGSGLAYKYNAPLLLVNKTVSDSKSVLEYITTNLSKTKNIYILGGTGVISSEIADYLTVQGYKIIRLGGKDRYETNQKIVDYLNITKGTSMVIATGNDFADALSISSIANIKGLPVLLNGMDTLTAGVRSYITNLQPTTIYLIGGTGVISTNVENEIKKLNVNIEIVRLGGKDRYETSMMIVDYFNLSSSTITVATGKDFPDALSGSVLAARKNSAVLLVDNKDISKQKGLLVKQKITNVILFGGEGVISNNIATSLIQK